MDETFKVTELFVSFEGEGLRSGELSFFIRLFGCNLDCSYCDSWYAHKEGFSYTCMTAAEILQNAKRSGCKNVTLTGGEPLIHSNIDFLLKALSDAGFNVNIETNGSVDINKVKRYNGMFFTCDYKCPCSGMTDKMNLSNLKMLGQNDALKFVVATESDLNQALKIIQTGNLKCFVYLSPVFGKIEPKFIAEFMKKHKLTDRVRLQLQLHKYVYPPNMRGV